jgi:Flp pilus assembly protein TadD
MRAEALRWREDFELGRRLLEAGDAVSLAQAYERLTASARAFPDSPLAGECHRLRGVILARQGRAEEAERERLRSLEHYPPVER